MFKVVLVVGLLAQTSGLDPRTCRDRMGGRSRTCENGAAGSAASFTFATSSGTGMSAECAGTALTSTSGVALTFTRASSAVCVKGTSRINIANGDLVTLTTDQPRVMTLETADKGLYVGRARTNTVLRSEEFDNAAVWVPTNTVAAAPTVTANFAVAPDGTTTAERVEIPATGAAELSILEQAAGCPTGSAASMIFVKGNGTSGVVDFGLTRNTATWSTAGGGAGSAFNSTTWTALRLYGLSVTSDGAVWIGNAPVRNGANTRSAIDILVWGGHCVAALSTASYNYVKTTSAAATVAAEVAYFAHSPTTNATGSIAATALPSRPDLSVNADHYLLSQSVGTSYDRLLTFNPTPAAKISGYFATGTSTQYTTSFSADVNNRAAMAWDGSGRTAYFNGAAGTPVAASTQAATDRLYVGNASAIGQADAVIKNVCVSTLVAECR